METAFAILALVAVLAVSMAGFTAVSMQVRCVDAAREAARLAARGDKSGADRAAQVIGPAGALLHLRRSRDYVVATVSSRSALLPGVSINAEAFAAVEPGVG
ncbi:MAG: hypothetical protein K0U84_06555 [Actinomycetia bacterium]|nr:hypothetical protein [Actinomycetes bacterium]